MARRREVFLRGKFLTFDRSNSFQLNTHFKARKNSRAGKVASSVPQPENSQQGIASYSMSDSDSGASHLTGSESDRSLDEYHPTLGAEAKQYKKRLTPLSGMQRSVSLGIIPKVWGTDHESATRRRLSLNLAGRTIKTFINTAIDPHVMKINPDGTIMISDETLAGSEFGPVVDSMTSSKEYVTGESQVLAVVLKHATQRIKKLLAPSKRKRRFQGPKTLEGKSAQGATVVSVAKSKEDRLEKPVGSTALMGYAAKPIQKIPLASDAVLVSPAINTVKCQKKWYQLQ